MEIWKTIKDYPNYEVSNLGNVKSLNYRNTKKPKILKNIKMKIGYNSVTIKRKIFYVHRLVAIHFIENHFKKREVNHINGIKNDNFIENLEYKFIEKEHQNVKYLLRDALIVYISVCAGYYILEQLPYNEISKQPVIVFTDPPNF